MKVTRSQTKSTISTRSLDASAIALDGAGAALTSTVAAPVAPQAPAGDRAARAREIADGWVSYDAAMGATSCDPTVSHALGVTGELVIGPTSGPVAPGRWALASRLASLVVNCPAAFWDPSATRELSRAAVMLPVCGSDLAIELIRASLHCAGQALSRVVADGFRGPELSEVVATIATTIEALRREHDECVATLQRVIEDPRNRSLDEGDDE